MNDWGIDQIRRQWPGWTPFRRGMDWGARRDSDGAVEPSMTREGTSPRVLANLIFARQWNDIMARFTSGRRI